MKKNRVHSTLPRKLEGDRLVNPTQAEFLTLTHTVGHLNHVNSVDPGWFVNTDPYASHWAATLGSTPSRGWAVGGFGAREGVSCNGGEWPPNGASQTENRTLLRRVQLVRADP